MNAIYQALSLGSQINPDENMDDDDENGMMFGDGMESLSMQGMVRASHTMRQLLRSL